MFGRENLCTTLFNSFLIFVGSIENDFPDLRITESLNLDTVRGQSDGGTSYRRIHVLWHVFLLMTPRGATGDEQNSS